ncbi:MAG: nucleotidyltransferase family protein [Cyclobacteriaceae bacterium]
MKLLQAHIDKLRDLCKKHYVSELYAFGSVVKDGLSSESDIDFLVRFSDVNPLEYFDNYMDFKETLEHLFSRKVDLVEAQTLKNPILKRSIDRNKVLIYGRKDTKVAV